VGYRDDREALHNRIAQLEAELEQARREGEEKGRSEVDHRAAVLEKHVREIRAELTRIERELVALRGGAPLANERRTKIAAAVAALVAMAIGGITFIGLGQRNRSAPAQTAEAEPTVKAPMPPAPTPADTNPPSEPTPPPQTGQGVRSAHPLWMAKVKRAEGVSLADGKNCRIEADITTVDVAARVSRVGVYCGGLKLYRSTDALSGISQSSATVREVLGPNDDLGTFTLVYRDIGPRSGERSQIDIDTMRRQAVVSRETIPRFEVELEVEPESIPGPPLADFEHRLRRAGKVIETTGASPVKTGASCVLRAMATGEEANCTAEIRCGSTILWPKTAPVTCGYEASRPASVLADGLMLDDTRLSVTTDKFGATIALDPP